MGTFDNTEIPKKDDHAHNQNRWTDEELLTHVREQHKEGPSYLYNEANRTVLLLEHQRAHHYDPISLEGFMPPGWSPN